MQLIKRTFCLLGISLLVVLGSMNAQDSQQPPKTPPPPQVSVTRNFHAIHAKIIEMAEDFPADKYDFRPNKDVRSFREVMVHLAGGLQYGSRSTQGISAAKWDEFDAKQYTTKEQVVELLKKQFADAESVLKAEPEGEFSKTVWPWMAIIEHAGEHYGQLVVYYRLNNLVPPETRKGNNG